MKRFISCLLSLTLLACGEHYGVLREPEPLPADCPSGTDLSWLDTLESNIDSFGWEGEIYSYIYKGILVFKVIPCLNCADAQTVVYTCQGKSLCEFGGIAGVNTCPDFDSSTRDKRLVWKN